MDAINAVRRARIAVTAAFLANGVVTGTWAAQIPLVQARLGVSHTTLGIALFSMAAGALLAMPLTGPVLARFGSAIVLRLSSLAALAVFLLPVSAPTPVTLAVTLFLFGAMSGVMDVGMNAHAVAVEMRLGRPAMSSFHGVWSLGGLIGAGLATLLLPLMPAFWEAAAIAGTLAVLVLATASRLLPAGADGSAKTVAIVLPSRATIGLGALCFLAMTSEGAITDWSALHLKQGLGLGAGLAASGFAAYAACMALGRFNGDWIRGRLGGVALVRGSGIAAAAGIAIAAFVPFAPLAVAGLALAGLGLANLVPVFFGAAGRLPGQTAGVGIAAVATVGYSGFVVGPPFIGFVADLTSLAAALGLVALACLAIGLFARVVRLPD